MGARGMPQPDQQPQQAPAPQSAPQPDPISQGLDLASQHYQQQLQANTPNPPSGGPVRNMLQRFFSGMGQSMMHEAGLQTPQELQQQAAIGLQNTANAKGMMALHEQMAAQYQPVPLVGFDGKPITDPSTGRPITLPANHAQTYYAGQLAAASRVQSAQIGGQSREQVALISQGGGLQLPVDKTTASLTGIPEGTVLGKAGWQMLNSKLNAMGYKVQDTGTDGPEGGMWMIDRAGNKVNQITDKSLVKARGLGFAEARAQYTPFETVEPGTNIPSTISNLAAIKTGAPRVNAVQAGTLGTKYAQFNDAYGILDNIDSLSKQVNLSDAGVRARVTAGYAALKEPATNGLTGEVLSNFLARQPVYGSLQPNERDLVLAMAQGKAAATGLRGILGQAGTNEMQQRLDAGMMPGGQTIASAEGIGQQTKAMRGLLDRFVVGQPQVGLNAPGTPSAINKTAKPGTVSGFAAWKAKQNAPR